MKAKGCCSNRGPIFSPLVLESWEDARVNSARAWVTEPYTSITTLSTLYSLGTVNQGRKRTTSCGSNLLKRRPRQRHYRTCDRPTKQPNHRRVSDFRTEHQDLFSTIDLRLVSKRPRAIVITTKKRSRFRTKCIPSVSNGRWKYLVRSLKKLLIVKSALIRTEYPGYPPTLNLKHSPDAITNQSHPHQPNPTLPNGQAKSRTGSSIATTKPSPADACPSRRSVISRFTG